MIYLLYEITAQLLLRSCAFFSIFHGWRMAAKLVFSAVFLYNREDINRKEES